MGNIVLIIICSIISIIVGVLIYGIGVESGYNRGKIDKLEEELISQIDKNNNRDIDQYWKGYHEGKLYWKKEEK